VSAAPLISFHQVSMRFGPLAVLRDISLEFLAGQLSLLGDTRQSARNIVSCANVIAGRRMVVP